MEEQLEMVARPCCCPGRYFMGSSRGRALQGVNDETLGTSNGEGPLQDGQQHGRDGELFSSEVILSLASAQ